MSYKSFEDFEATKARLKTNLDAISACSNFSDLSKIEIETVRILQLLEVQISEIGRELYETVRRRRADIQMGVQPIVTTVEEKHEDSKRSNTGRSKRQSNSKTKRASK